MTGLTTSWGDPYAASARLQADQYVVLDIQTVDWGSNDEPYAVILGRFTRKFQAKELLLEVREKIESENPNVKFFKVKNGYDYPGRQLRIFKLPPIR